MDQSPYFQKRLTDKVYAACLADAERRDSRRRVKFSELAAGCCGRALWFGIRGLSPHSAVGSQARADERGRLARRLVARDLRKAGFTVKCGFIYGLTKRPHLLEIQAVPEAIFKRLEKFGLGAAINLEITLHSRLGLAKMERALFVAENRNTQELYFEKVRFDPDIFNQVRGRLGAIRGLAKAPAGCFDDSCSTCGFRSRCQDGPAQ